MFRRAEGRACWAALGWLFEEHVCMHATDSGYNDDLFLVFLRCVESSW